MAGVANLREYRQLAQYVDTAYRIFATAYNESSKPVAEQTYSPDHLAIVAYTLGQVARRIKLVLAETEAKIPSLVGITWIRHYKAVTEILAHANADALHQATEVVLGPLMHESINYQSADIIALASTPSHTDAFIGITPRLPRQPHPNPSSLTAGALELDRAMFYRVDFDEFSHCLSWFAKDASFNAESTIVWAGLVQYRVVNPRAVQDPNGRIHVVTVNAIGRRDPERGDVAHWIDGATGAVKRRCMVTAIKNNGNTIDVELPIGGTQQWYWNPPKTAGMYAWATNPAETEVFEYIMFTRPSVPIIPTPLEWAQLYKMSTSRTVTVIPPTMKTFDHAVTGSQPSDTKVIPIERTVLNYTYKPREPLTITLEGTSTELDVTLRWMGGETWTVVEYGPTGPQWRLTIPPPRLL